MSKVFIGKKAPDFNCMALVDGDFKKVKLDDYKGKWLVLFFYPMDFTFVCPTEIIEFDKKLDLFKKLGCEIVGASCDSEYVHLAWTNVERKKGGIGTIKYPLLADKNKKLSKDYGVLFEEEVSLRGLFIIDPKQKVRQITINDLPVGRSISEVLRLVKAFQFVEKNGQVCPMNWDEGKETIIPEPKKSQKFFGKVNK